MKLTRYAPFFLVLFILGCASLGLEQPTSLDQRLAYAYSTHTAVLRAATDSLNAHEISSDDAQHVSDIAAQSRLVLDSARAAFNAGDMQTAEGRLLMATGILQQLQDYLRAKEKP